MVKVFINPGHSLNGKPDAGCVYNGIKECDIARQIAIALQNKLRLNSIESELYQQNGDKLTSNAQLNEVPKVANKSGACLFLSIHMNGFNNETACGTETWYAKGSSNGKRFAELVNSKLTETFGDYTLKNRGAKVDERGFLVLKATSMPAILTEIGFISNKKEAEFIKSHVDAIADRLLRATLLYFGISEIKDKQEIRIKLLDNGRYDCFVNDQIKLSGNRLSTCLEWIQKNYGDNK